MDRRRFLKGSMLAAAAAGTPASITAAEASYAPASQPTDGDIIDVNVDLCCWPYRSLKYGETDALVRKLRSHGVRQAWAGSYDAMLHKNLDAVNRQLAAECMRHNGFLIPFGAVNPAWPDWEEDLRRVDEEYGMAGIKLIPGYHGYTLDDPDFVSLLGQAAERDLVVQIAIEMEDERMRHPRAEVPVVDVVPLSEAMDQAPGVRVVLINPFRHVRKERVTHIVEETDALFEISNLDGTGGVELTLTGDHWYVSGAPVPAERLLFGSHAPFFPLESALFKFMESELEADVQQAILSGNAENMTVAA